MISFYDWAIHFPHALDALVRVRVITDDVAQTNEIGALVFPRIRHHRIERLEIGVNVTENGKAHIGPNRNARFVIRKSEFDSVNLRFWIGNALRSRNVQLVL